MDSERPHPAADPSSPRRGATLPPVRRFAPGDAEFRADAARDVVDPWELLATVLDERREPAAPTEPASIC